MQLNVSTKTLSRWRKDGLRWRWVTPFPTPPPPKSAARNNTDAASALDDQTQSRSQKKHAGGKNTSGGKSVFGGASGGASGGRRVIGFTAAAVEHYRKAKPARIAKATAFTQLTAEQRSGLIARARRLASTTDATFNQVAAHLAKRTHRALETVRLILEKHDRDHPAAEDKLFADRTGPLTARQKRLISRAHRMGIGVGKLAERFRRSRATIHRVVLDRRAARSARLRLTHVPNAQFTHPDAADVYIRASLEPQKQNKNTRLSAVPLDGLPVELQHLYQQPVVSADKIRSLFLRYNFLKHRAAATRDRFTHAPARAADLDAFEFDIARAARVRSLLVTWHLPVVLSVARRHLVGKPSNTPARLLQLLEAGNPVLIEAVESYDATARPTFESVLTNRLLRDFASADATLGKHGKAQRRASAAEVMQRMIDLANESGVHLAITEDSPDTPPDHPDTL